MEILSDVLPIVKLALSSRQFSLYLVILKVWHPDFNNLKFLKCILADVTWFFICEHLIKYSCKMIKAKLVGKLFELAEQE